MFGKTNVEAQQAVELLAGDVFTHNWEGPRSRGYFTWAIVFASIFAGLVWLIGGLLQGGYATGTATHIQGLVDAGTPMAGAYPYLPFLLAELIGQMPLAAPLAQSMSPYMADAMAAALLLGLGYQRLVSGGASGPLAAGLILAIAANPIFPLCGH